MRSFDWINSIVYDPDIGHAIIIGAIVQSSVNLFDALILCSGLVRDPSGLPERRLLEKIVLSERAIDTPDAIVPVYLTPTPNQPIHLYSGPMRITQGSATYSGEGTLRFGWLPKPGIEFHWIGSTSPRALLEGITISFPQLEGHQPMHILQASHISPDKVMSRDVWKSH